MTIPDDDLPAELDRELGRVEDRLRAMPLDRLRASVRRRRRRRPSWSEPPPRPWRTWPRTRSGRPRRPLPVLAAHGVADQLAVTAHDVLVEGGAAGVRRALDVLVALRRAL